MGQYQQWLEYQEVQKRLSSQVEALEAEITQLQAYLEQSGQQDGFVSLAENPIVQALIAHLPSQPVRPAINANVKLERENQSETYSGEFSESISPALRTWGGLPNFELNEIKEASRQENQFSSFFNHSEIELLPEDMIAFFDEHEQTDPQLELPWWLRKITVSSKDEQAGRPIDHNSIRTNRLVQRWIERWGRQPSTTSRSLEKTEEGSSE